MKILYVASDQRIPGSTGGSIHVWEVARGLGARGHEVHAVVDDESAPASVPGVSWHRVAWTPQHRFFRFRARRVVEALGRRVGAQAVIERYYNFGGEGIGAAARLGIPSILEVNSPVVDHPGSLKAVLDAALLIRPMKRHRENLCRQAAALLSPLESIVPAFARPKTHVVTWGANVEAFDPSRRSEAVRAAWGASPRDTVVIFSGSFRPWHGVHVFEDAAARLRHRDGLFFVLVGGERTGPASSFRGTYLGSVPYERMPGIVASADIGAAPYDTDRLKQLRLGFFWSPLKVFEYMASGLPTVTIRRDPLDHIVRDGREALFFDDGSATGLADAIAALADDEALRRRLGESARQRVVEKYSWTAHCAQVERVLERVTAS